MRNLAFIFYDPRKFIAAGAAIFIVLPLSLVLMVRGGAAAVNQPVQPYTGGQSVSRVFYPADGSTITVTCTGAVIKQSTGGTPYRQGWVDPSTISSTNSFDVLRGHIRSGATNPYSSQDVCQHATSSSSTSKNVPTAPQVKSSKTANKTTYSTTNNYYSQPQSSQPAQSTAQQPVYSNSQLPRTGAGGALALGGICTVFATLGHFFYQRLRFRSSL